jgi:hypothetical protein
MSSIPFFNGTFTVKYFPTPYPIESNEPVPGKKSYENS